VLLLDEFQTLVHPNAALLLDLIRQLHGQGTIWFVLAGLLRPASFGRECPETQLTVKDFRVDYLSFADGEVERVLRLPVTRFGVEVPDEAVTTAFQWTAGSPFHLANLASAGLARLNGEHRTVLSPDDVEQLCRRLASDQANFNTSSFSTKVVKPAEQDVAIRFAKLLGDRESMPLQEACEAFDESILESLRDKLILRMEAGQFSVRGKMLKQYLQERVGGLPQPLPPRRTRKRVGVFVDPENVQELYDGTVSPRALAEALLAYASREQGDIVTGWVVGDPNKMDINAVQTGFETAELDGHRVFSFTSPPPELTRMRRKDNDRHTDIVLIKMMRDEIDNSEPEVFVVVSADKHFYTDVKSFIDDGYKVVLLANPHKLAPDVFPVLEQERRNVALMKGEDRDFVIEDIAGVISKYAGSESTP
jgi:hypothetical protein